MLEQPSVINNEPNANSNKTFNSENYHSQIYKSNSPDKANLVYIGVNNLENQINENYYSHNTESCNIRNEKEFLNSDTLSNDQNSYRSVMVNSVTSSKDDSIHDCNLNKYQINDLPNKVIKKDVDSEFSTNLEKLLEKNDRKQEKETFACKAAKKLGHLLLSNILPISFIAALIVGIVLPQIGNALSHKSTNFICLVVIFLYSGLYLPSSAIKDSLKAYKAAVWGFISILFISCIIASQLTMLVPFHEIISLGTESFKTGLVLYYCAPCTVTSGILMVTQLNGNYALAVLLTVATNVVGVFTSPLLLKWMLKTEGKFKFDVLSLLTNLLLSLLLPLVIGKLLRFVKVVKKFSTIPKIKLCFTLLNITALAVIIMVQVSQLSQGGGLKKLTVLSTVILTAWSLAMHFIFLLLNATASWLLRLEQKQTKCIVILSSQKTPSTAMGVLTFLPASMGDRGLMAISIIIAHLTTILFDSMLVSLWIYAEKIKLEKMKKQQNTNDAVTFSNPAIDTKL